MKKIVLREKSGPESLEVVESPTPTPGPGQILLRTTSIGVNRAELMATVGHYPVPPLPIVLGIEAGGVIESLGSGVNGWKVGDRVSPIHGSFMEKGHGSWAEFVVVDAEDLWRAPENIEDPYIGGLWLPYATAWHGLETLAEIDDSMTVVVPAASSSVGLAALQICECVGARGIGTTTSPEKVERIAEAAGISRERVIVTASESLSEGLDRILGENELVDVFFDPVGGDFLDEEIVRLRPGGAIVLYGGLGGRGHILTGRIVMKEARILGLHLGMVRRGLRLSDPDNIYAVLTRRFERGYLKPTHGPSFPLERASEALQVLGRNEHIGKLYLVP